MDRSMPMVEAEGDGTGRRLEPACRARASPAWRSVGRSLFAFGVGVAVLLVGGFGWFLWNLPADEVVLHRDADGIVVLTGGASRIADAIELLAAGRGKRLLISGVNEATTPGEILHLNPDYERLVGCCVDFDRSRNTLGNAIETKHWVESRGFRSLIVVTSNYHMPRAIAEITHQLPGVALLPFPVIADKVRAESWWTHGPTARLMFFEYLKYVAAQMRIRLDPGAGTSAAAAAAAELAQSTPAP
jgi:uncharacterized SAM-binding protein YcdF (DUF218 family)